VQDHPRLAVALCADEVFLPHLATTVVSLLEKNIQHISNVFVIVYDVSESKIQALWQHVHNAYGFSLQFIRADNISLDEYFTSGHISKSAYLRLHMAEFLPTDIHSVLYLDSDLIVVGDLAELLGIQNQNHESTSGIVIWAVPEIGGHYLKQYGFKGNDYFNSGVMLINLRAWRDRKSAQLLIDIAIKAGAGLRLWDQDALNLVFEDSWSPLPRKFNSIGEPVPGEKPLIVHFASGDKPWKLGNRHPARAEYRYFRDLTPFPYRTEWDFQNVYRNIISNTTRHQLQPVTRFLRRIGLISR